MPNIVIKELDLTSPGSAQDITDIVYVPGFVDVARCFPNNPEEALQPNKPTLFTTVSEFETLCGSCGVAFDADQKYSDVSEIVDGRTQGFDQKAVPSSNVMFAQDTVDPGYVMAKELLNAGLPVLYERVNPDYTTISIKTGAAQPSDWEANATINYYVQKDGYIKVSSVSAPELMDVANGTEYTKKATDYYIKSIDGETIKFTQCTSIPAEDIVNNIIVSKTTYYKISSVKYCLFTAVPSDAQYKPDTEYYQLNVDLGFVKYESSQKPESWIGFYTKADVKLEGSDSEKTVPQNWIDNYLISGYIATKIIIKNTDTDYNSANTYEQRIVNPNIKVMYSALRSLFDTTDPEGLVDKGNYSLKYLTSGGYPTYEYVETTIDEKGVQTTSSIIYTQMEALAAKRGDCVAFIDSTDYPDREPNINKPASLYQSVVNDPSIKDNGEFATMLTPWATYTRMTRDTLNDKDAKSPVSISMPATYAYLISLARSLDSNPNWLTVAGASRGIVRNLAKGGMKTIIPNGVADAMQPRQGIAINAITNINPYGNLIWGNRTLKFNEKDLTATSFLNIRNLVSDVKKVCYRVARKLTFEQNNDVLWVNFKSLISPTLDRMTSGYGISGYKIIRDLDNEHAGDKATITAKIIIYPQYAVEDFYITIVLRDEEISVQES